MRQQTLSSTADSNMYQCRIVRTAHFVARQQSRGVRETLVAATLSLGRRFYSGNCHVYFFGRKQIARYEARYGVRLYDRDRANGIVVVAQPGTNNDSAYLTLVTVYRNPKSYARLRARQR